MRAWVEAYAIVEAWDYYEAKDWIGVHGRVKDAMDSCLVDLASFCDTVEEWTRRALLREAGHFISGDGINSLRFNEEDAIAELRAHGLVFESLEDIKTEDRFVIFDSWFDGLWGSDYGGEGWRLSRDLYFKLRKEKNLRKRWHYVDLIFDVEHNTGLMMMKTPFWMVSHNVLNFRKHVSSMLRFFEDLSPLVRKATFPYYRFIKDFFKANDINLFVGQHFKDGELPDWIYWFCDETFSFVKEFTINTLFLYGACTVSPRGRWEDHAERERAIDAQVAYLNKRRDDEGGTLVFFGNKVKVSDRALSLLDWEVKKNLKCLKKQK
jgi:hypothetical protein